jgi:crotonyl-CoA carboxylase/reductase
VREDVAFQTAERYAREIVPGFSAFTYFSFAIRAARFLSQSLYRVRLVQPNEEALAAIPEEATVIFVMNHRSNMDYVLVTWLAAERSALAYAVGEWARVWPFRTLVRAMGGYFIRRRYNNPLYRKVLARYVQMATEAGVTQAVFPEGGLSRTGALGKPKLGLISYILDGFRPGQSRDVVFVPVALNYDRVMEDRNLIEAQANGARAFRFSLRPIYRYLRRQTWLRLTGKFHRYGYAAAYDAPRRTSTRSASSRRWAMCRGRCTPGRSAASAMASPTRRCRSKVVDTPTLDSHEVLVLVMAAGVNYNGVWAGLGEPISPFDGHKRALPHRRLGRGGHRLGRGRQGQELEGRRRGRHPLQPGRRRRRGMQRRRPDVLAHAADLGLRDARRLLRQFTRVQAQQLMPRPKHLTWEESACYTLTLATAYRMLFGHHPHELKPGQNVLVWGASGGLGSYAIQLANTAGANAIGVISDEDKRDFVMGLGAKGVINRKDFNCWGQLPKVNTPEYKEWFTEARKFGKAIWDITGKGVNVDMVFEHPGEATFPVSTFVCKKGGMVVICAGTTGFNCTFDVRYMWMHQKRLQGSHFRASQAGRLGQPADDGAPARPLHVRGLPLGRLPQAHMKMLRNEHKPGNMAVLVQAPRTGLRTLEDVLEAGPTAG